MPAISKDVNAKTYLAALLNWREEYRPLENELRQKRIAALDAVRKLRDLVGAEEAYLPDLLPSLQKAIVELNVFVKYVEFTLQAGMRKGANKADKTDQALEGAVLFLLCKGLSRNQIAKDMKKDRRQITEWGKGATPFVVDVMREHLGLREPFSAEELDQLGIRAERELAQKKR